MFGWLSNWWRARARRNERRLFEFFDGRGFRRVDPWPVYRAVFNDDQFIIGKTQNDPADMVHLAAELNEPEFSHAVACVHRAFKTQPYDHRTGYGLTDPEAFALLVEFLEWCADLVKKNDGSPTSLPPTASTSSTGPECPADPTNSCLPSPCSTAESIPGEVSSSSTA
jgi:hypothetical protein